MQVLNCFALFGVVDFKFGCEQALKLVDSVHASADQYTDGGTLKKQLKDAARAVFPDALAAASSQEQSADERAAAAAIATPRLPVLPEWGCVRIDHHSAKCATCLSFFAFRGTSGSREKAEGGILRLTCLLL